MYKLVVYIPEKSLEKVKKALFSAGAGRLGNYDSCAWQTKGTGQFRPLEGSDPHIGHQGEVETLVEWRLETLVEASLAVDVKNALLAAHPYEEPAFEFLPCVEVG